MPDVLVAYSTKQHQTEAIAAAIVKRLQERGLTVDAYDLADRAVPSPGDYAVVALGGAIHIGHHARSLRRYVEVHRDALAARPTAFFSVSLSAARDRPEARSAITAIADAFERDTGWQPDRRAFIAGALKYSEYGFFTRWIMKRIAAAEGGDTDTSRDYEYTDWAQVTAFADEIAALCERARPAPTP